MAYKVFATMLAEHTVRVAALRLDGVAWFSACDVARSLGYAAASNTTKMLAIAQQSATDAKERCSTLEAELRRMQGRRDALVDENTALSHKVRPLAWPWRD